MSAIDLETNIEDASRAESIPGPLPLLAWDASVAATPLGFGWDAEPLVQVPDHLQGKRPFVVEDLVHTVGVTDQRFEILDSQPALLHYELDRLYRIG